jgi:hypothetical protein
MLSKLILGTLFSLSSLIVLENSPELSAGKFPTVEEEYALRAYNIQLIRWGVPLEQLEAHPYRPRAILCDEFTCEVRSNRCDFVFYSEEGKKQWQDGFCTYDCHSREHCLKKYPFADNIIKNIWEQGGEDSALGDQD